MASVEVGQEAPDFTLKNENNQDVTLSSLRGKPVVLMFYPLDGTGGAGLMLRAAAVKADGASLYITI